MAYNEVADFLHEILRKKVKLNPWAPIMKHIDESRLHQLDLDELHFRAVKNTASDHRLVELFPGPVVVLDEDGSIVSANESALSWMGKGFYEVEGEFVGDLLFDRRRKSKKSQFLSPIIEVLVKEKECFLAKSYVTTTIFSNPIPVEISTKQINDNGRSFFAVVICNEFSAGSFDREIMSLFAKLFADNPEILLYFTKYISGLDVYTRGHCKQVAEYAGLIGVEMGFNDQELENLYIAAMLHDIGNLAVSPEILHKEGKLTPTERREMQIHPVAGADILEEIAVFQELAPHVRHHHERYDGKGYPDKLCRDEIPLISRVLAVADAFDAMTSYRPYRTQFTLSKVREELLINAGSQFDPYVVKVAVKLIDSGKLKPSNCKL